ncbi:MAG: hypothetical protein R3C60_13640 [Parvularculaceae bacterium]
MFLHRVIGQIKAQNWFMVGVDFLIVVFGVLIAFQITNWNDARKAKAQLAEAETVIKSDLFFNYVYAQERVTLKACRMERLRDLSNRLLEPGQTWIGMPIVDGSDRALDQVFRAANRPWRGRFWHAELARGTLNGMNANKRENLDFIFKSSEDVWAQQNQITEMAARLKPLSTSMKLTQEDRLHYLDIVSQIDENSWWTELKSSQLCAGIESLGLKYDADEQERLLARVRDIIDLNLRKKQYGECVRPVVMAIFNSGAGGMKSPCSSASYN